MLPSSRLSQFFRRELLAPSRPRRAGIDLPLPVDFLAFGAELLISLAAAVAARRAAVALVARRFRGGECEVMPQWEVAHACHLTPPRGRQRPRL